MAGGRFFLLTPSGLYNNSIKCIKIVSFKAKLNALQGPGLTGCPEIDYTLDYLANFLPYAVFP